MNLEQYQLKAESGDKSCLVCKNYRYCRGKIICSEHPEIEEVWAEDWNEAKSRVAHKRAMKCKQFYDMRP